MTARAAGPSLSRRRRMLFGLSLAVAVLAVLELASRVFLLVLYQIPLWPPGEPAYRFYGNLRAAEHAEIGRDDDTFDVLLLGASVLNQVAPALQQRLDARLDGHARVFNVCGSGHTSLDSVYKYRHLASKRFDLVLVYHGINELRTNNASPEEFRDDYSHYSFYALVNLFENRHGFNRSALVVTLRVAWIEAKEKLGLRYYVPRNLPMEGKMQYGDRIKSCGPFRANLERIVGMARRRRDPLALMTFATYVPADYTDERFLAHQLDYYDYELPIRLWGLPENVIRGMAVHNAVVREVAHAAENAPPGSSPVLLIPEDERMPKEGRLFIDICHLSPEGIDRFVDDVIRGVAPLLPPPAVSTDR